MTSIHSVILIISQRFQIPQMGPTDANLSKLSLLVLLSYFNTLYSKPLQPQSHPYRTGVPMGQVPFRQD